MDLAQIVNEYGFPVVMMVGLGYFIYYIWNQGYRSNKNARSGYD